jgi:hypothetical protein
MALLGRAKIDGFGACAPRLENICLCGLPLALRLGKGLNLARDASNGMAFKAVTTQLKATA